MACGNILFYLFAMLVVVYSTSAHEGSGSGERDQHQFSDQRNTPEERASFHWPFFGNTGSSDFGSISDFGSLFGSRQDEIQPSLDRVDIDELQNDDDEENPQSRLFFTSIFGRRVTCNFATQPGATCLSCRQALTCGSNNVGSLKTCRFFHPYCNNGRCSVFPGTQCTATATTTVATTTDSGTTTT